MCDVCDMCVCSSYATEVNMKIFWSVFGRFLEKSSDVAGKLCSVCISLSG